MTPDPKPPKKVREAAFETAWADRNVGVTKCDPCFTYEALNPQTPRPTPEAVNCTGRAEEPELRRGPCRLWQDGPRHRNLTGNMEGAPSRVQGCRGLGV